VTSEKLMCAYGPVTARATELQYPAQAKCSKHKDCICSNAEVDRRLALASFLGCCILTWAQHCLQYQQAQNFLSHTSRQLLYCTKRFITWRDLANLAHSTWGVGRLCKAKSGICARSPIHIPPQIRLDTANRQFHLETNLPRCCFYIKCKDLLQHHDVAIELCIGCIGALHAGILCIVCSQPTS